MCTNLVQIVQVHELPFTAIAVIRRMCIVNVILEIVVIPEYAVAIIARKPMLALLVSQTGLSGMGRPACEAPATFYFVGVLRGIVEVVPHAIEVEGSSAAGGHV